MSVACSLPRINLSTSSSSPSTSSPPAASSSSSSSSAASSTSVRHSFRSVAIRCSQTDGPLRRPVVPPLRELSTPAPITPPPSPSPRVKAAAAVTAEDKNVITLEFQRLKAKELQDYFRQKKVEEANHITMHNSVKLNISLLYSHLNRWAMFGFAVGMLTEYATGSSFVDQVKTLLSNFGIVDLE